MHFVAFDQWYQPQGTMDGKPLFWLLFAYFLGLSMITYPIVMKVKGEPVSLQGLAIAVLIDAGLWAYPIHWRLTHKLPSKQWDPNTCTGCGYCLAGNMSGVCPECGTATNTNTPEAWLRSQTLHREIAGRSRRSNGKRS